MGYRTTQREVSHSLEKGGGGQERQQERRNEMRIQVSDEAHVVSLHTHTPVDCAAAVADVSKDGIGLATRIYLPRDLLLKIELDSAIIFGEVRHCSRLLGDPESFRVGIAIQTVIFRDKGLIGY